MKNKILICLMIVLILTMFTGCNKTYWEYDCVWVSNDPYVYLPADGNTVNIEIDGELYEFSVSSSSNGLKIWFSNDPTRNDVWEMSCEIKKKELYLTVVNDKISNHEGDVIVLHQEPKE